MKSFPTWAARSSNIPAGKPSHWANSTGTAFKNPWPSAEPPTWTELVQTKFPLGWYESYEKKHPETKDVKVVVPDWGRRVIKERGLEEKKKEGGVVVGTSLGHAGVITELPLEGTEGEEEGAPMEKKSLWVVYDPIFSDRAGPTQYTGPQRLRPPPCQVTDLPGCDAVMISHNHYDHLDLMTIRSILNTFPKAKYFVPLGNKTWLLSMGVSEENIHELDWWQKRDFSVQDFGHINQKSASHDTMLRFTCVPAQHNSGRGALDQGVSLWCGWVIEQLLVSKDEASSSLTHRKGSIYHAGDTGYRRTAKSPVICPIFAQIGAKFGGFDLSFVPIWRGGTLGFFSHLGLRLNHNDIPSALHASPEDAVDIHVDVKSRHSIAVHFGTFVGSVNESLEAVMEFEEGRVDRGVGNLADSGLEEKGRTGIIDIGGSWAVEIEEREVIGTS